MEADSTPTFDSSSVVPSNASPAMNSDIVNPIPASRPTPTRCMVRTPAGRPASPKRTAAQEKSPTPMGLPISRPSAIPSTTGLPSPPTTSGSSATPALARAKSGMIPYATHGTMACSMLRSGDCTLSAASSSRSSADSCRGVSGWAGSGRSPSFSNRSR